MNTTHQSAPESYETYLAQALANPDSFESRQRDLDIELEMSLLQARREALRAKNKGQ